MKTPCPYWWLRFFSHCASSGVGALQTGLRRSLGARAPVSRQTMNQQQFVTHRAATRALPPSLGLRSVLFTVPSVLVRLRSMKNENKPATGEKEKTMKLEEIKGKTNEAVSYLVAAPESGQSDVLTQFLNAMARFHNYSFGTIMLIARQRAMTCCYTSLESMNMRLCALLEASDGEYHIC